MHGSTGFRFLRDDLSIQSLPTASGNKFYNWDDSFSQSVLSDSGEHIGQLIRHGVTDQLRLNAEEYPIMIARTRSLLLPDSADKVDSGQNYRISANIMSILLCS